jgi:hypothetical protein
MQVSREEMSLGSDELLWEHHGHTETLARGNSELGTARCEVCKTRGNFGFCQHAVYLQLKKLLR